HQGPRILALKTFFKALLFADWVGRWVMRESAEPKLAWMRLCSTAAGSTPSPTGPIAQHGSACGRCTGWLGARRNNLGTARVVAATLRLGQSSPAQRVFGSPGT